MSKDKSEIITIESLNFRPYISKPDIENIIQGIANKINEDYKESDGLHIIIILTGAYMFGTDLSKLLNNVASVNHMKLSSYEGTSSTGSVKIDYDLKNNIENKDILIIEDIIDTGLTMNTLCQLLATRNPNSMNICTMLLKTEKFNQHKNNHKNYPVEGIKYIGREIDNQFVIGYGLDLNEKGRNLDQIYILDE